MLNFVLGVAFHRHDGPYAAASANRNKGPRSPMAAFPAQGGSSSHNGSSAPRANRLPSPSVILSPLAQATLAAMDHNLAPPATGGSPYIQAKKPGRRNSDSSISMGFPSHAMAGKGGQLIEMFGVR